MKVKRRRDAKCAMRNKLKFTGVLLIIGFLAAIQYNSMQKPQERDTRDIWAIRNELATEKQFHSELLSEVRELDRTTNTYESLKDEHTGRALSITVEKLYNQAGMTDIKGPGIEIEIRPSAESVAQGIPITGISPDLLTRFVNELNRFKGHSLEIDGKRFTVLSSIRDINGITAVNGVNISTPPFKLKIITQNFSDSEKLYNALLASLIHDDFYLDDLIIEVGKPKNNVEIRGWKEQFEHLYLNELPKGE